MAVLLEKFVAQLAESGALAEQQTRSFIESLPAAERPTDGEQLAKRLVKEKKISAYQAQVVYSGKGKLLTMGSYFVLDKLGQGGMGMVLKAEHRMMKRLVAIKVLSPAVTKTDDLKRRFQREVEAAARLTHPNIVGAFDAGESNGSPFLVMEYVPGSDLSSIVKKSGPLPVGQAIDCIIQAARGLEFAHSQGVIHRDIKPANLLLDTKGVVKILDMGLARIDSADVATQADLTGTGAVMGTIDYMAPEQALSTKTADARSDLYSLGISLWLFLTGRPVYEGDSLMARLLAHREQPIPSLKAARPDAPDALDHVFKKLVAKKPADRYQTATELIADLQACRTGASVKAMAVAEVSTGADDFQDFLDVIHSPTEALPGKKRNSAPTATRNLTDYEATMSGGGETVSQVRLKQPRRAGKQAAPSWFRDRRVLAGAGASAVMLVLAVLYLVRAPSGTLRVESLDPAVEMTVKGTDLKFRGADLNPATVTAGATTLQVVRGDLAFETEVFEIRKGLETRVKAELIGDKLVIKSDDRVIGERAVPRRTIAASTTGSNQPPGGASPVASAPVTTDAIPVPVTGAPIDLLAKVTLPDDCLKPSDLFGDWTREGIALVSPAGRKGGRLKIPFDAPQEYEMTAVVERLEGRDGIMLGAIVGGYPVELGIDVFFPSSTGLTFVDQKGQNKNETERQGTWLGDRNQHTIRVTVGPRSLRAIVDDREVLRREGDPSRLSSPTVRPNPRQLWIRTALDRFRFHRIELRPLSGVTLPGPAAPLASEGSKPKVFDWPADAPKPAVAPFDAAQAKKHQEAWAAYRKIPVEKTNSIGMKLRLIPPGEFLMGSTPSEIETAINGVGPDRHWRECVASEGPQHRVILTQPVYLGVSEVTQSQYEKVMGANRSSFSPAGGRKEGVNGLDTAALAVDSVSWNDAAEFCEKLSLRENLTPYYKRTGETVSRLNGTGYRLPSEAEWEFACRAGTTTRFWSGDERVDLERAGWMGEPNTGRTHTAGDRNANPFGLYDVHGNVWEWTQDAWNPSWYGQFGSKPAIDPMSPPLAQSEYVFRGGSWADDIAFCRSSGRFATEPVGRHNVFGLRVVLTIPTSPDDPAKSER